MRELPVGGFKHVFFDSPETNEANFQVDTRIFQIEWPAQPATTL